MKNDISKKIEECIIASAWVKAETQITNTSEIYKIKNAVSPFYFLNGIYRTCFGENNAEILIKENLDYFNESKIGFRWYCFPHSLPQDLEQRLIALNPTSITELLGLYCYTEEFKIDLPEAVTVEELSKDNLDDYCQANNEGWEQTGIAAAKIASDIKREFNETKMPYQAFLARYNGEPASTGIIRIVGDSGYLLGGSTVPRFRKKGVYSGLVFHRMKLLRSMKIPLALILARKNTSAPICLKLGFQVGCHCKAFEFN